MSVKVSDYITSLFKIETGIKKALSLSCIVMRYAGEEFECRHPDLTEHQKWVAILVFQSSLKEISSSAIKTKIPHLVNIHRLISFDI